MKPFSTTILLLLIGAMGASAQIDVSVPRVGQGMTQSGDDLYFSGSSSVYKIDLSATTPEATLVMDGLGYVSALAINGTDLYVADYDKIYIVDLTASTLVATELVVDRVSISDLLIDGDDMYITEQNAGKISKIDITETSPTVTEVISGLSVPTGLAKVGDTLYVTRYGVRRVTKVDLSSGTLIPVDLVITEQTPAAIAAIGNYVYYTEFDGDEGGLGKMSRIDITKGNPTPDVLLTGFDEIWSMDIHACNLYYADPSRRMIRGIAIENVIDTSITAEGRTISSNQTDATYQWINCSDNSPIDGETSQSFTATANGDYAVVVLSGGCSDTSKCVNVTGVGLNNTALFQGVSMYPNPGEGVVNIDLGLLENVVLNVFDSRGQLVHSQNEITTANYQFNLNGASAGVYMVELNANNVRQQYKLMVK